MVVVGLGKAGCNIAKAFSKFPQYETYGIDIHESADITIRAKDSHEEYDTRFPNIKRKLKFTNEDVLVVVCGAGTISGGTLRLLEQIKNNRIRVLYIQGDTSIMSERQKKQDRIVSNILQEYARSGVLEEMILINNAALERSIGDMSILGYYDTLNQAIVNTIHMINIFRHTEPVIGNFITPSPARRISTIGVLNLEGESDFEFEEEEKWFYPLTHLSDVVYYYGINEEDLKNDGTLLRKINHFVRERNDDEINISYGVFKTTYEQKYCYCIRYTSMVQSYAELLDD